MLYKRAVCAITVFFLLITAGKLLTASIHAAERSTDENATLQISSGTVLSGKPITVEVTANLPEDSLGAATIEIAYDPLVLTISECKVDPESVLDFALCNPKYEADGQKPDVIRFNILSTEGISGTLRLAQFVFLASGESGAQSSLTLKAHIFTDADGLSIAVDVTDGSVRIVYPPITPSGIVASSALPGWSVSHLTAAELEQANGQLQVN